jgi:hypothetical protein
VAPRGAVQGAAGVSWSAHQVALLQGMGFDTLRLRGAGDFARAPAGAPVGAAVGAASAATGLPSRSPAPAPVPARRAVAAEAAPTVASTAAPTAKLLAALRLAAGGRDPIALAGDLEALRRDPARKRELWPRLRALRRPH